MKKLFTILILLSVFIGLSFGQVSTNGLIGYWSFNGNANDESGNGHNGTVTGATLTTDRFGNTNSSYSFINLNQYIDVNNFTVNTNQICISYWIYITSLPFEANIISHEWYGNTGSFSTCLHQNTVALKQHIGFALRNNTNAQMGITSKSQIFFNQWYNIVCNFDSTNQSIYINGILDSTKVNPFTLKKSTVLMEFGNISNLHFNGKLDDIRIYKRALNQSEISALYNENICITSTNVTDTLFISANLTGFNPITYQNNIKIYPNPTFSQITIDCGNNYNTLNGYTIKIVNSLSQTVYTSLVNKQISTIDLKTWTGKGIYIIQLIDDNQNIIENKKIVLQ